MNHHDRPPRAERRPAIERSSPSKIAFGVFIAVALFFLLAEHRAHFFGFLPFLLILACPLMHLFHHGGHGGHGTHKHSAGPPSDGQRGEAKET